MNTNGSKTMKRISDGVRTGCAAFAIGVATISGGCGGGGGGGKAQPAPVPVPAPAPAPGPAAVAPGITQQPQALVLTEGAAAAFTVAATGTAPLTYQWQRNGVSIAGATLASNSLIFVAADLNNALAQPSFDVMGFRLGMTYEKARARAMALKMKVDLDEHYVQIQGLPNARYRPQLMASDMGPGGLINLGFSPPPGESRLVAVNRTISYANLQFQPPAGGATVEGMLQRFGKPSTVERRPFSTKLVWQWNVQRQPQPRDLGTPCQMFAARFAPDVQYAPSSDHGKRLIASGCGIRYEANLQVDAAGVVSQLDQSMIDATAADSARRAAEAAVAAQAQRKGSADLERANKQKPVL